MNKGTLKIIATVALGALIMSLVVIGVYYFMTSKNNKADEKQELVLNVSEEQKDNQASTMETIVEVESEEDIPANAPNIKELQKNLNKDIYAWVKIPDTGVDYAIVQHPEDDSYYLNHNYDDSYGYPACIFTESYNTKTFEDALTVVYGRNMKDGTMFAQLHKFNDKEYFDQHKEFVIFMEDKVMEYDIIAAYKEEDMRLTVWYDFEIEEVLEDYVNQVMAREDNETDHIRKDVETNGKHKYVALETSIRGDDDHRYIVLGRRK